MRGNVTRTAADSSDHSLVLTRQDRLPAAPELNAGQPLRRNARQPVEHHEQNT